MRRITVFLACLSLVLLPLLTRADEGDLVRPGLAGLLSVKIPNQYIVVLKDDADLEGTISGLLGRLPAQVTHRYSHVLNGFTVMLPDRLIEQLRTDPRVVSIVQDEEVWIQWHKTPVTVQVDTVPTGVNRINAEGKANKGAGIEVAILDTGIDTKHPDLKTNILGGKSCVGGSYTDGNGHGTHVAGTIAALENGTGVIGVAPKAKLWAVKVLNNNGSGTWGSVICGIDWVTSQASHIKVANMSLGGYGSAGADCASSPLRQAICNSVAAGVTYAVAAGNEADDVQNHVPAAYPEVITVSALADSDGAACGGGAGTSYGADDTFASFSNYATRPEDLAHLIAAPGVSIRSTWKLRGYNTISGTSMATPHVAGAVALYLSAHPGTAPADVMAALLSAAEAGDLNFNAECALGNSHDGTTLHPEPVVRVESF